jgi:hypothetical protein
LVDVRGVLVGVLEVIVVEGEEKFEAKLLCVLEEEVDSPV